MASWHIAAQEDCVGFYLYVLVFFVGKLKGSNFVCSLRCAGIQIAKVCQRFDVLKCRETSFH